MRSKEFLALIEKYIDSNPSEVAMRSGNAELATTIKYLQRARYKLPTYYTHRCIIDGQLFEQSSSEATAIAKFEGLSGDLAIDLTCGLGVDSSTLASKFKRVITIEIDQRKAEIARENFSLLGLDNIEVVNSSSEDFIAGFQGDNIDLVYVDPSRIKQGAKVYSLEDSSPNIVELLPKLRQIAQRICIKLSPLFDVEECYRIFGDSAQISVVSSDRECKEVLVNITNAEERNLTIDHIVVSGSEVSRHSVQYKPQISHQRLNSVEDARYIYIPDVVFYKARTVENYLSQLAPSQSFTFENYIFTEEPLPVDFQGVGYSIDHIMPYKPKAFKALGIPKATLHIKGFPYGIEKVKKELKVKEGAGAHLLFTTVESTPMVIVASRLGF